MVCRPLLMARDQGESVLPTSDARMDGSSGSHRRSAECIWMCQATLAFSTASYCRSTALQKSQRDPGQKLGDDHDLGMLLAACADTPLPEPADWEGKEQSPLVVRDCRAPRFVFPAVNAENAVS